MNRIRRILCAAVSAATAGALLLGAAPAALADAGSPASSAPGALPEGALWEASGPAPGPGGTPQITPYWEFNWGIVTGTLYLNRNETRNARDAGYIVALGAAVCSAAGGICMPIAAQAGGIAIAAGRYYEEGNCVKLKIIGPTLKPERQKRAAKGCY